MKKHKLMIHQKHRLRFAVASVAVVIGILFASSATILVAAATTAPTDGPQVKTGDTQTTNHQCGSGDNAVYTSIDIGCYGASCHTSNPKGCNALTDATFAIIRFLSVGIGIIVVASMVWAGIQYTTSRGDPAAVSQAKQRIVNNVIALLVYIFAYAILNYVIPQGFLNL
jgi:heme A synthase